MQRFSVYSLLSEFRCRCGTFVPTGSVAVVADAFSAPCCCESCAEDGIVADALAMVESGVDLDRENCDADAVMALTGGR